MSSNNTLCMISSCTQEVSVNFAMSSVLSDAVLAVADFWNQCERWQERRRDDDGTSSSMLARGLSCSFAVCLIATIACLGLLS